MTRRHRIRKRLEELSRQTKAEERRRPTRPRVTGLAGPGGDSEPQDQRTADDDAREANASVALADPPAAATPAAGPAAAPPKAEADAFQTFLAEHYQRIETLVAEALQRSAGATSLSAAPIVESVFRAAQRIWPDLAAAGPEARERSLATLSRNAILTHRARETAKLRRGEGNPSDVSAEHRDALIRLIQGHPLDALAQELDLSFPQAVDVLERAALRTVFARLRRQRATGA